MNPRESSANVADNISSLLDQIYLIDMRTYVNSNKITRRLSDLEMNVYLDANMQAFNEAIDLILKLNTDEINPDTFQRLSDKFILVKDRFLHQAVYILAKNPDLNSNNKLLQDMEFLVNKSRKAANHFQLSHDAESMVNEIFSDNIDDTANAINPDIQDKGKQDSGNYDTPNDNRIKINRDTINNESINDLIDSDGNTALHHAVLQEDEKMIAFLMTHDGVRTNIENLDGDTPIDLAAKRHRAITENIKRSTGEFNPLNDPRDKINRIISLLKPKKVPTQVIQPEKDGSRTTLSLFQEFIGWDTFKILFNTKKNPIVNNLGTDAIDYSNIFKAILNRAYSAVPVTSKNFATNLPASSRKMANPLIGLNTLLDICKYGFCRLVDQMLSDKGVNSKKSSVAAAIIKGIVSVPIIAVQAPIVVLAKASDSIMSLPEKLVSHIWTKFKGRKHGKNHKVNSNENIPLKMMTPSSTTSDLNRGLSNPTHTVLSRDQVEGMPVTVKPASTSGKLSEVSLLRSKYKSPTIDSKQPSSTHVPKK